FGKPGAYYGTVEQQGRMTLHLHFLLWVEGSLPLQEIRTRLMSEDSIFTKSLLAYMESCHVGDFHTGSMEDIQARTCVSTNKDSTYIDPTLTLPIPPPQVQCTNGEGCVCDACREFKIWCDAFWCSTDDIMYRSNIHRCYAKKDNTISKKAKGKNPLPRQHPTGKGCVDENGNCTSRFPRPLFEESNVELDTGHINMKKREEWINTVTPIVTAVNRCNTDTTCLMSGTAVKATVAYVTDYVTKSSLRTHQLFSIMYDTYTK
ncbi:hypothetical protein BJ165DRAFT_1305333, partial [Panaeolus papilionaceus]